MVKQVEDLQRFNQAGIDMAMKMMGEWGKGWQAIAAEMTDYTKRSFEDGTGTVEKMMGARSLEQAIEIQTSYARQVYDDYMHQMTKIGSMYSEMAKDGYQPMEKATSRKR